MNDKIFAAAMVFITAQIGILVTYYFNSKAKAREIKLLSYYKDRIEAVKNLYGLIVTLQLNNGRLFKIDHIGREHSTFKSQLQKWLADYSAVHDYYSKNRILLLEKTQLSERIRSSLNSLSPLATAVYAEYKRLYDFEEAVPDPQQRYHNESDERDHTEERIRKLMADPDIAYVISSFDIMRKHLEEYFKALVS